MTREEIDRQREIGKQLFIVSILHHENDRALRGGYSFLSKEELATWASMTKDDITRFMSMCATLEPINLASDAAMDCSKAEGPLKDGVYETKYPFTRYAYHKMGELFVTAMEINEFKDYCERFAEDNYRDFCQWRKEINVPKSYASPEVLETMMHVYLRSFVAKVKNVLSKGYDWDVVASMIRMPISEERFHVLDKAFGVNGDDSD